MKEDKNIKNIKKNIIEIRLMKNNNDIEKIKNINIIT